MTDRSRRIVCAALLFSLSLNGCVRGFRGTTQTLEITSDPSGVSVLVLPYGERVVTPAKIKASRVRAITLLAEKFGYRSAIAYVEPQADSISALLIFGDLLFVPFFLVPAVVQADLDSGATFALRPDPIHLELEPKSANALWRDLEPESSSQVDALPARPHETQ
jgi:hypothetical protein